MKNEQMIYVHIPFCNRKCYYCGFVSVCDKTKCEKYFERLEKELISRKNDISVSSIYLGGGTPGCVEPKYINNIIQTIKSDYNLIENTEITLEANPTKQTFDNLEIYKKFGINRISFGIQSLDDKKLKKLGREQDSDIVKKCLERACQVFDNVSADLLIGLEGQTVDEVLDDIDVLYQVGVKHFSVYMLMVEEGTKLSCMVKEKKYKPLDDEKSVYIYEQVLKFLKSKEIYRYEISNFAKIGYQSRHNLGYWQMKPYLGFGASAHSFQYKNRFFNSNNVDQYINSNIVSNEVLSKDELDEERIMLGLRTVYGVEEKYIKNETQLENLLQLGVIVKKGNNIVIEENYFNVANQIILKLV